MLPTQGKHLTPSSHAARLLVQGHVHIADMDFEARCQKTPDPDSSTVTLTRLSLQRHPVVD